MSTVEIQDITRLDHHGIVAGVIRDLGIVDFIDSELGASDTEVSTGSTVAAMIINGLGFSDRPLSLTPQFFEQVPVEYLLGDSVSADKLNRHRLGRTLDQLYEAGVSELFTKLSKKIAKIEDVDTSKQVNDTTSFSLTGEYEYEDEPDVVKIKYGHSKDHRPDLKQIVHELVVSCDEGIPLHLKSFDGNASDTVIFRERVKELKKQFCNDNDSLWIADSKLYSEKTLAELQGVRFLTRIPETNSEVKSTLSSAFSDETQWEIDGQHHWKRYEVEHFGISQSWLVSWSEEGLKRATKTLSKRQDKEFQIVEKEIFHLQAQLFGCREDAELAVKKIVKKMKLTSTSSISILEQKKHDGRGRPKKGSLPSVSKFQIQIQIERLDLSLAAQKKAAFVLGTSAKELSNKEILENYKKQGSVERGFRFLKDPYFFVSSLYLKKPSRIESLLMIMTLSLLVYTVAQRRLRKAMTATEETIPNQAGTATSRPTLRWVFQIFYGINIVRTKFEKKIQLHIQGLKTIHLKLLKLLSGESLSVYIPGKPIG